MPFGLIIKNKSAGRSSLDQDATKLTENEPNTAGTKVRQIGTMNLGGVMMPGKNLSKYIKNRLK